MATRELEDNIKAQGYKYVIGLDEVGRGCLAGPVTIAACVLPEEFKVKNVKDSKKLSPKKREKVFQEIIESPGIYYETVSLKAPEVDSLNILQATLKGMKMAIDKIVQKLPTRNKTQIYACIDGDKIPRGLTVLSETVEQGDTKCMNIAAASIIAKVIRDRMMVEYESIYPGWGFAKHKGYGTTSHREKINEVGIMGVTPLHRHSFSPLKRLNLPNT